MCVETTKIETLRALVSQLCNFQCVAKLPDNKTFYKLIIQKYIYRRIGRKDILRIREKLKLKHFGSKRQM